MKRSWPNSRLTSDNTASYNPFSCVRFPKGKRARMSLSPERAATEHPSSQNAKASPRLCAHPLVVERDAENRMRFREVRLQANGLSEFGDRAVEVALVAERHPPVKVGLGVVRLRLWRAPQSRLR